MGGQKKRDGRASKDDGVVTSAPASSVGSLLTDLLSEAKADVAAERQQLEAQIEDRNAKEREAAHREEARKREQMQRKLIEETRRRNEALARKDRKGERESPGTAKHTRPDPSAIKPASELRQTAAKGPPAKGAGGVPLFLVAAMVLVGVGLGVGGAMALAPKTQLPMVDVQGAARATVAQTAIAAGAEEVINNDLIASNSRVNALEKELGEVKTAQSKLTSDLQTAQQELKTAKEQLVAAKEVASKKKSGRRHTPKRSDTGPDIKLDVFK